MCGRYAASADPDKLVELFEADLETRDSDIGPDGLVEWTKPRWNIAPTDPVAAVVSRTRDEMARRLLVGLQWGLVPSWSKGPGAGPKMINARLETVAEKPAYRKAFASRRCLIPADGYYEWYPAQKDGKAYKQPFYIHPADGHPGEGLMVMAGIYEFWKDPEPDDPDDPWLATCSIITTQATDDLGMIHDRMPVQVLPQNWADWLDPKLTGAQDALDLVHVPSAGEMTAYAVATQVNSVRHDGPSLVAPLRGN